MDRESVVQGKNIACNAVGERDEALYAKEIYVCLRDGRRICLVELIDANGKKAATGTGWHLLAEH